MRKTALALICCILSGCAGQAPLHGNSSYLDNIYHTTIEVPWCNKATLYGRAKSWILANLHGQKPSTISYDNPKEGILLAGGTVWLPPQAAELSGNGELRFQLKAAVSDEKVELFVDARSNYAPTDRYGAALLLKSDLDAANVGIRALGAEIERYLATQEPRPSTPGSHP